MLISKRVYLLSIVFSLSTCTKDRNKHNCLGFHSCKALYQCSKYEPGTPVSEKEQGKIWDKFESYSHANNRDKSIRNILGLGRCKLYHVDPYQFQAYLEGHKQIALRPKIYYSSKMMMGNHYIYKSGRIKSIKNASTAVDPNYGSIKNDPYDL